MAQNFVNRLFYSLIISSQLLQIVHVEAKPFWNTFVEHKTESPLSVAHQINSLMKLQQALLLNSSKKISFGELVVFLNYLKQSMSAKRARYPEYWLLREG